MPSASALARSMVSSREALAAFCNIACLLITQYIDLKQSWRQRAATARRPSWVWQRGRWRREPRC